MIAVLQGKFFAASVLLIIITLSGGNGVAAREINISDTSAWLSRVAEASVAAKACGFELSANKVMGEMLVTFDSMDSFTGEYFGAALDRQEAALKLDRDGFCQRAWDRYGSQGRDLKNLLLPGR
jgi:hypothetical protein